MTQFASFVDDVELRLKTHRLGRPLRSFPELPSTNTEAAEWANAGGPAGGVVLTDSQTAGRGRHGRTWHAERGRALAFSVLLRPAMAMDRWGLFTLAASVAVTDVLRNLSLDPAIKWPNDVLIDGKKCCGILLETGMDGASQRALILGVGVNVNQESFPPQLSATSLRLALGRPVDRGPLLAQLLLRLGRRLDELASDRGKRVRRDYRQRMYGSGRRLVVRIPSSDERCEGILEGITDSGALKLRTETGIRVFHAGEVTTHL